MHKSYPSALMPHKGDVKPHPCAEFMHFMHQLMSSYFTNMNIPSSYTHTHKEKRKENRLKNRTEPHGPDSCILEDHGLSYCILPSIHKDSPASPSSAWGFGACTTGSLSMHHRDVTQTACFQNKYFIKGVMSPVTLSGVCFFRDMKGLQAYL